VTDARPPGPAAPYPVATAPPDGPPPSWQPARPAGVPGLRGSREDLRSALLTVLALAVFGLAAGGLWIWLAPRADYRVTATDVVPIGTAPSSELFMADDGVFVLILAGLGLLAGIVVWLRRRRRGALTLVALATGLLAAGVVAWQLGEWAGPSPTTAQLHDVGARVTTGLSLGATAALAVGPFVAVLTYLVATALTSRDDLGRGGPAPAEPLRPPLPPVPPTTPRGQAPSGGSPRACEG
jgi:LPXTG-motif cell wall-anchored protein